MQRWYPFLNKQQDTKNKGKSLHEHEIIEKDNLIICQKLKFLQFSLFKNYLHFVNYMIKNTVKEQRCFYELIPGSAPQKPYFDIEFYVSDDIEENKTIDGKLFLPSIEADQSIEELVRIVKEEIPDLSTNKSHVFVFTSHKETKRSYHVVVEGFCFSDNKSNKIFCENVMKKLPEKWKGIIDTSMYKSSQQFRIAGNCKFGTDRFKTLNEKLTLNWNGKGWIPKMETESDNLSLLLLIESSLITQTNSCVMMQSLLDENEENSHRLKTGEKKDYGEFFEPLTSENIKEALTLCHKVAGLEYGDSRFPYSFMRVIEDNGESSIILLKRRFASMCRTCNRIHENENPFLLIVGLDRDIYLDCRRNDKAKKLYVGKLGPTSKAIQMEMNQVKEDPTIFNIELTKEKTTLPCLSGIPSISKTSLPDLKDALNSVSQMIAPKIKPKEKKNTGKATVLLNFDLYKK
jgi:hypothetical protein